MTIITDTGMDTIIRVLSGLTSTLSTHSELLERIWAAATEEPPPSELPGTLKILAMRIAEQEQALLRVEAALLALPAELAKTLHGVVP